MPHSLELTSNISLRASHGGRYCLAIPLNVGMIFPNIHHKKLQYSLNFHLQQSLEFFEKNSADMPDRVNRLSFLLLLKSLFGEPTSFYVVHPNLHPTLGIATLNYIPNKRVLVYQVSMLSSQLLSKLEAQHCNLINEYFFIKQLRVQGSRGPIVLYGS